MMKLEGTARYACLLLATAEGFGLRPKLFLPFGQKRAFHAVFFLILDHFRCSVVTSVVFSSNLRNFFFNPIFLYIKINPKTLKVPYKKDRKKSKKYRKISFFILNLKKKYKKKRFKKKLSNTNKQILQKKNLLHLSILGICHSTRASSPAQS